MDKKTTRASEHPPHAWEAQRQHFTVLYRDEKRKLAEVQQIMESKHGFYATTRQYKRKIKAWGLEKNSKAMEKCHALTTLKKLDTNLDIACVYKLHGKDIAAHKLLRYARSQGFETPKMARNAVNRRKHSFRARSQSRTTSLAFSPNKHPGNKEPVIVDLHWLFASTITFLWFEEWHSLDSIPRARSIPSWPSVGFLKWTTTVLSTTQISTSIIIVAALYVYRLKSYNPAVIGKAGSEYRLATVALMLANKFIDDNTYTNRTWAEVTGISVEEVHIMEIEFLSNMRYSLMVQPRDWDVWCKLLGELQEFLRQPREETTRTIELLDVSQSGQEIFRPEVSSTEMHNIHHVDLSDSPASNAQKIKDSEMLASPATGVRDVLDSGVYANVQSEMQHPADHGMQTPESNGLDASKDVLRGVSDGESDLQTNQISNDIDNEAAMVIDTNVFELMDTSFVNMLQSPPFPRILTMELRTPVLEPEDALLEWRPIDSSEVQEGPIPDLDVFLDPSLWEDSSQFPLLEQFETAVVQEQRSDGECA